MLEFQDVYKEYSSTAPALLGVSFRIEPGEFTALAGPSGSGKTTILNLAAGLDVPSRGRVLFMGQDLGALGPGEMSRLRRRETGFVFQSFNLFPVLTAHENVEYPLALKRVPPRERRERAFAALKEVGLEAFAGRRPSELSGGQQQRVAVARAMVSRPKIVFADEPTASLDSHSAEELLKLFEQLNRASGTTFLFSSHDPRVLQIAHRIIRVMDGRIEGGGPEIFYTPGTMKIASPFPSDWLPLVSQ
jgi:putative ABC transport system ATP-binding protein